MFIQFTSFPVAAGVRAIQNSGIWHWMYTEEDFHRAGTTCRQSK